MIFNDNSVWREIMWLVCWGSSGLANLEELCLLFASDLFSSYCLSHSSPASSRFIFWLVNFLHRDLEHVAYLVWNDLFLLLFMANVLLMFRFNINQYRDISINFHRAEMAQPWGSIFLHSAVYYLPWFFFSYAIFLVKMYMTVKPHWFCFFYYQFKYRTLLVFSQHHCALFFF